jgi:uncharacterized phiE125 gp8 family phage protein
MRLNVVTPPASEPVTSTDAKLHLRVDGSSDDTLINALITAGRQVVETRTKRALINTTFDATYPAFPDDDRPIVLPVAPVSSIAGVSYYDYAGTLTTLATSAYRFNSGTPASIEPSSTADWPSTEDDRTDAVIVRLVAGYGSTSASVPATLRQAVLMLIGGMYENRESIQQGQGYVVNPAVAALCDTEDWGFVA